MEISGGGRDVALEYSISMERKTQDHQKIQGAQMIRLIDASGGGPVKLPPGPNSTISVRA
jgi:hypothetical protein